MSAATMEKQEKAEQAEEVLSEQQELDTLRTQVLHLLVELEEAQRVSQRQEENGAELQGLLEDERLASAHQAETFARQIQCLQAQLCSAQKEMEALDEQKERDLAEVREKLGITQEEVQLLRQAAEEAEEAAATRENDIASLQEELCHLRTELGRMESTAQEYELEMVTLRAEIAMKSQRREQERREGDRREGEMDQLKQDCADLKAECEALKQTNGRLAQRVQLLQRTGPGSTCMPVQPVQAEGGEHAERSASNCRLVDVCIQKNISFEGKPITPTNWSGGFSEVLSLRDQLKQAEERAEQVQRQCDRVRTDLRELQDLFETSQKERAELELELLHCREELEKITDGGEQQE